jgi:hypothetical protein
MAREREEIRDELVGAMSYVKNCNTELRNDLVWPSSKRGARSTKPLGA